MLNDDTRKPKNRMPRLFMNDLRNTKTQIKSWWHQFKRNSESSSVDDSSSQTTLDWRSLSPDRPPLPFFLSDNSSNSSTTSVHNDNLIDKKPISSIPALLADTTLIDPSIDSNSKNTKDNNSIPKSSSASNSRNNTVDNYQPLCPILEESETMATDSNESNVLLNSNSQIQQHSSSRASHAATDSSSSIQLDHLDNKQTVSLAAVSSVQEPSADQQQQPEILASAAPAAPSASSSLLDTDSSKPWPEIKAVQKTPSDRYMPLDLVGNEELCKRKFAKMVLAANKFQNQQQRAQEQDERPSQMALLFDVDGNIDMMRMVRQGKSEYHKFCGNSQYVPPELSVNVEYQSELADIWVLGVFLYRMLVGKYPFSAANDQQLFKKMLHSDFSIPNELSDDAKDIIKRMLAPDSSRASLDLIIYHPWIKYYRPLLLDHYHNGNNHNNNHTGNTMKANRPIFINNNNNTTAARRPPLSNIQQKKRSILGSRSIRRSNSVNTTTPSSSTSSTQEPKPKKAKPNTKQKGFIKKAFLLLFQGPFPPPKKPYQELAHLGTRESVFAKHRT
ncbi:UDP-glucose 6-dehydrogenase 4 [Mucor velutinosus]|uniref:UDP-glucose 6-dehydrogenase 4 n=1 Tax=Mucor velutinosus TaxID=708070 RepID=A0AAN7D9B1_9FUNG|nr:UDP-glucose 6-dehydrogenase 4 [Mucor velutinosus]